MADQVFDARALAFFGVAAGFAFILGLGVGWRRREGAAEVLGRALEGAALAALGGFLARTFIRLLLAGANDSPAAALAVGWGFFLWPGAVDTLLLLLHRGPVFTPPVLLWTAAGVGAVIGMMDGIWRIHPWRGWGAFTFALDVTWGLAGGVNGCLVHLMNFCRAERMDLPRAAAHRYLTGFRLKAGYALTLGSVMSNLPAHAGDLVHHELTHVLQNRLFGPLYTLTYVGWAAAMFWPALAAGLIRGRPLRAVEDWCYLNNPWEAWAFRRGGWRDPGRVWRRGARRTAWVGFFLAVVAGTAWVVWRVWLS